MASTPRMEREPFEGGINVVSSFIAVDFPAPFGPKNPKTWPGFTVRLISLTALTDP